MIVDTLADMIGQSWSLLRERQWANWQLLMIVAVPTAVLILAIARLRRTRLAGPDYSMEDRSAHTPLQYGKRGKASKTVEQLAIAYERIKLLRHQIIERDQTEARLEREISELTAVITQLQHKIEESNQARKFYEQEFARLTADDKKSQQKGKHAGDSAKMKVAELTAANKKLKQQVVKLKADYKRLQPRPAGRQAEKRGAASRKREPRLP